MKTSITILGAALATFLASGAAFAEPDTDRDANGHRIEQRMAPYGGVPNPPVWIDNGYGVPVPAQMNQFGNGHVDPRYLGDRYLMRNWRDYGLAAPPAGHRWVRVGDRAMLVTRNTGRIANSYALR